MGNKREMERLGERAHPVVRRVTLGDVGKLAIVE
jgi:hypothetical protein